MFVREALSRAEVAAAEPDGRTPPGGSGVPGRRGCRGPRRRPRLPPRDGTAAAPRVVNARALPSSSPGTVPSRTCRSRRRAGRDRGDGVRPGQVDRRGHAVHLEHDRSASGRRRRAAQRRTTLPDQELRRVLRRRIPGHSDSGREQRRTQTGQRDADPQRAGTGQGLVVVLDGERAYGAAGRRDDPCRRGPAVGRLSSARTPHAPTTRAPSSSRPATTAQCEAICPTSLRPLIRLNPISPARTAPSPFRQASAASRTRPSSVARARRTDRA